ncbi:MAG TPA: flagellar assembly protein FliX [Stellaceae bacterium]|nr:flagellar assembly protein FliX [Stellaceae bacterium]
MRIEWEPPLQRAKARRDERTDSSGDTPFSSSLTGSTPTAAPASTAPLPALDGLLSIQEIPDAVAGRRRAVQRGNTLLDRLDELRLDLLSGTISRAQLEEIARVAGTARGTVDDPRLGGILDEIDLRVAVELAKLDACA